MSRKYKVGRAVNHLQQHEIGGLSRGWSPYLFNFIWDRDKSTCIYCGADAQAIDHVVPKKFGGPTITANGVLTCTPCNYQKGASLSIEFLTHAFAHLLRVGEDLGWVQHLWIETRLGISKALEDSRVVNGSSWDSTATTRIVEAKWEV